MKLENLISQQQAQSPAFATLVAAQDYPAIAERLNAPTTIANPDAGKTATATVYPVVTLPAVLALVPSAERVKIRQLLPGFSEDVKGAIDSGDTGYMIGLVEDALTATAISAETAAALTAILTPSEVQTTAPATIAGPSLAGAAGLGTVTAAEVQAVLNA